MTKLDAPCPTCDGKEKTKYIAMVPLAIANGPDVAPHRYSIGAKCYRKQWKQVYPNETCPV